MQIEEGPLSKKARGAGDVRATVRQQPGVLDDGAGLLSSFSGHSSNRRVGRFFARCFAQKYKRAGHDGAFKTLSQCKKILELRDEVTSGEMVASLCSGFGKGGISIIDAALAHDTSDPHGDDAADERLENEQGLLLWAIMWQNLGCTPY